MKMIPAHRFLKKSPKMPLRIIESSGEDDAPKQDAEQQNQEQKPERKKKN